MIYSFFTHKLPFFILLMLFSATSFATATTRPGVINMGNQAFLPGVLKVSVGQRVVWMNTSNHSHDVTSMDGDFHSGKISPHQTYTHVFKKPGTYYYSCSKHAILFWGMKGKVVVTGA